MVNITKSKHKKSKYYKKEFDLTKNAKHEKTPPLIKKIEKTIKNEKFCFLLLQNSEHCDIM